MSQGQLPVLSRTPPPQDEDESLAGFSNSPTKSVHEHPFGDENFSAQRNVPILTLVTTTAPSAESTNSVPQNTPQDSHDGLPRKSNTLMVEDANGVFNFQPASMAKLPVSAKSVSHHVLAVLASVLT